MKNYSLYIRLSFLLLLGLFVSCSEDNSSLDINPISGVVIDTTGAPALYAYQFENLQVQPKLVTDLPESDLSYTWKINLQPGDTLFDVIGHEKNLDYEVEFRPNSAGRYHQLVYTVVDDNTGLEYIMSWPVTVLSNIGQGLVVAETSDDVTTDLSHIKATSVSRNFTGESVKYNVYSTVNEEKIPGLVKQMKYYNIRGEDVLLAITDDAFYAVNSLDFSFRGSNDDLFYGNVGTYAPQTLDGGPQSDVVVYNGKMTSTYMGASREWGLPFDSPGFVVPDHIAVNPFNYWPLPVMLSFFDEENQIFVYQPSITQFGDRTMYATPNVGGAFNPAGLSNMRNLAADVSNTGDFLHLLKNEVTGEVGLYILDGGGAGTPIVAPAPKSFFDLTEAPGIEAATEFAFLDNQKVLYYASGNKLFAVLYGGDSPVIEERYTVSGGEEITTLQVFQQANYPFDWNEDYIETNNRQLIMSTYNGAEGKVYILPFINLGLGNIDSPNVQSFEGFGRITAVAPQM